MTSGGFAALVEECPMRKLSALAVALTLLSGAAPYPQNYGSYGSESLEQQHSDFQYQSTNIQNRAPNYQTDQGRNDYQQGREQDQKDDQGADRYPSQGPDLGRQRQAELRDNRQWSRGDRFPRESQDGWYVVSDWRSEHLKKPPRGYHWIRANDQYVLAALANGYIAEVITISRRTP
jgi:Ni/Co efflux regulator RcnB